MTMIASRSTVVLGWITAAALSGCLDAPPTDHSAQALGPVIGPVAECPTVPTDIHKSLVVTEPETLALFSFQRVMDQVLGSVKHDPAQTSLSVFKAWMSTYAPIGGCPGPGVDPHGYGIVCPRTREASLATANPFDPASPDFFRPVAVFNRFDMAPQDGSNCGEYRIVYAKQSASGSDRGFLIFEAVLPNPEPEKGLRACFPVASFWQQLSELGPVKRAIALETFYFTGLKGFSPVVDANNYGLVARRGFMRLAGYGNPQRAGQVRTNMFVDASGLFQWNLREFKLDLDCTNSPATEDDDVAATVPSPLPVDCRLRFEHLAVANNPANELFASTHANAPAFQADFNAKDVETLAAAGGTPACGGGANIFGMAIADDFNEFESVSSGLADVVYDNLTAPAFRAAIQTELTAIGSSLTPKNILDRATTQTCAGCHQHSNGAGVGGGIIWPSSAGFVHVTETSALSPALTTTFLPFRKCVLDGFIDRVCNGLPIGSDGNKTVSGQSVGAAN